MGHSEELLIIASNSRLEGMWRSGGHSVTEPERECLDGGPGTKGQTPINSTDRASGNGRNGWKRLFRSGVLSRSAPTCLLLLALKICYHMRIYPVWG